MPIGYLAFENVKEKNRLSFEKVVRFDYWQFLLKNFNMGYFYLRRFLVIFFVLIGDVLFLFANEEKWFLGFYFRCFFGFDFIVVFVFNKPI